MKIARRITGIVSKEDSRKVSRGCKRDKVNLLKGKVTPAMKKRGWG